MFPFPEPLSADQRQTLEELVPPVEKFFQEVRPPPRPRRASLVSPAPSRSGE